jgi:hemolysin III
MVEDRRVAQDAHWNDSWSHTLEPKPLLRGWLHAIAAVGAVVATIGMVLDTSQEPARLIAMLIFGLSMINLYSISALYHLGRWQGRRAIVLHALDRANIFVLIAGTYTPICMILLDGVLRVTLLALIWLVALAGMSCAVITIRLPRWASTGLYLGMGWLSLIVMPTLFRTLPASAFALIVAGGLFYSIGAIIYALRRPDPWPHVLGFHEIFHLFVVAGSVAFLLAIWGWVVPFAQG